MSEEEIVVGGFMTFALMVGVYSFFHEKNKLREEYKSWEKLKSAEFPIRSISSSIDYAFFNPKSEEYHAYGNLIPSKKHFVTMNTLFSKIVLSKEELSQEELLPLRASDIFKKNLLNELGVKDTHKNSSDDPMHYLEGTLEIKGVAYRANIRAEYKS